MENKSCDGVALHQLMHGRDSAKRQSAEALVAVFEEL